MCWHTKKLMWGWNSVCDETKHWIGVEGIIFIEGCSGYHDIAEFGDLEVDDV
jgi:hypothetical protein